MKAIHYSLLALSLPAFAQSPLPALIPQPQSIRAGKGQFTITAKTQLAVLTPVAEVRRMVQTNLPGLRINDLAKPTNNITVRLAPVAAIGREGYELVVSPTGIRLTAPEAAGIFYGLQTLRQLLPAERERPGFRFTGTSVAAAINGQLPSNTIPALVIRDQPRFGWRGMMLDVSRSFFTKEYVRRFIDLMARYKYNVFHWHLSDDQGWRIEIKSLPRLTQVGAWRAPRTGRWWDRENPVPGEAQTYGGFYTQDDIREVVQYAAERQITVVPEIDMPGHSLAAIAAYPGLTCGGKVVPVYPNGKFYRVEDNNLNPCNDSTYLFIDQVFTEIAQLFPGPYIHVGGDEAYKGFWEQCAACKPLMAANNLKTVEELQSYFIRRVEKIVQSKGKRLIGWDEILEGGLAPNATVMSWRGMNGGIAAAKQGHPVIMTPYQQCYVDLYQGDPSAEPSTYGMCRLSSSYAFEPVPDSVRAELILGGQANLWTESVPTTRHAEYMVWPRAFAIAEVLWSPKSRRDWPDFVRRIEQHFTRFDMAGVNYSRSYLNPFVTVQRQAVGMLNILLSHELADTDLFYTTDNTIPDALSPRYLQPFVFPKGADRLRVAAYRDGKPIGRLLDIPLTDLNARAR